MTEGVVKWLHNPTSRRGKRLEDVGPGCFVLEHDATGRFYVGESNNVSAEVDKQLAQLAKGGHPCKLLNRLYERDDIIRVFEYPTKSMKERKTLMKSIVAAATAPYLYLK